MYILGENIYINSRLTGSKRIRYKASFSPESFPLVKQAADISINQ